ncbi:cytochrome o ubiquinol oxidase subunit 1 [Acidocella aromatica]|uniref:Cytochrome o ubiquinol oxidase subunit 1 n=1 Tax=Acidocella aromatica TaxID=1303579 RepID=A0A840VBN0_9PROT|nr:cytochrome o ubiquinol oxidase subunit 1 [Acidocella aromatica]
MQVAVDGPWSPLLGRLTLEAIPYTNPILLFTFAIAATAGIVVVGSVLYFRKVGYIWREWLCSVDHKRIGVMYMILGLVMLFRGFIDGVMMRTQQAIAIGPDSPGYLGAAHGYLPPYHFDQVYSAHGTLMLIFAATPLLTGLGNIIVPLQIGARDMAFPYLNAVSLWLTVAGALLCMISLFVGEFSNATWVGLMPFAELPSNPGVGVDYWMWALQISGLGTTFNAINIITTIVKMRAPGMGWFRVPVFTWVNMATAIIGVTAFPVLTAALAMLGLDRYVGTHFFSAGFGGNYMLYINLFWTWGHPEVYFLVLPAFGLISEIVSTFSAKSLFGYPTMIAASMGIAGVGWVVWAHHFFTMGMGPNLIGFFSAATMIVGIPTGVKAFNWVFTMFRGRITLATPMLWAITCILLLLVGGITGMMLSASVVDYTVHDSVFVVAHFHCMVLVIGGGVFAAVTYWWPKVFGFKLNETLGQWFFWTFVAGSVLVFVPMFMAGLDGETRRLDYLWDTSLRPLMLLEVVGIAVYFLSVFFFLAMIVVSLAKREPAEQDAWGTGRSLEWLTQTPVPFYNFAVTPQVHALDELSWRKANGLEKAQPSTYVPIHMPSSTGLPFIIGMLGFACTFALVWRIWWLAGASLLAIILLVIIRSFDKNEGYVLPAETIAAAERNLSTVSVIAEQSKVLPVGGHAEAH